MGRPDFGTVRIYKVGGGFLYIPQRFIDDKKFPFQDGDIVKTVVRADGTLDIIEPKPQELEAYNSLLRKLSPEEREEIKGATVGDPPVHLGKLTYTK